LSHTDGAGYLSGGGSFSALVSPDGLDATLIIETLGTNCSTHCPKADQTVEVVLPNATLHHRQSRSGTSQQPALVEVEVWLSDLSTNDAAKYFVKQPAVQVLPNGTLTLRVPLNSLMTVTTATGRATKGSYSTPAPTPFPLPYTVDYSTMALHRQGQYLNDQQGVFEIARNPINHSTAIGLLQTVNQAPIQWVFATPRPLTIFGSRQWGDVVVSTRATIIERCSPAYETTTLFSCKSIGDFRVPGGSMKLPTPMGGTFVSVGARVMTAGNICGAGKAMTNGYFFLVHANSTYTVTKGSQHILAAGTLHAAKFGLPSSGSLVGIAMNLEIEARGTSITARLNGANVTSVIDADYPTGFASLACGWHQVLYESTSVVRAPANAGSGRTV
jgi:hypothetical protein